MDEQKLIEATAQLLSEGPSDHKFAFMAETSAGMVVWCVKCGTCVWRPDGGKMKINVPKHASGPCVKAKVSEDEVLSAM